MSVQESAEIGRLGRLGAIADAIWLTAHDERNAAVSEHALVTA